MAIIARSGPEPADRNGPSAPYVISPSRSSGERIEVMRYLKVVLFGEIAFSGPRRALSQRVTILQTALLC